MICETCHAPIEAGLTHCPTSGCPNGPQRIDLDVAGWTPYRGENVVDDEHQGERDDSRWWR